jgi:hypothetical protein
MIYFVGYLMVLAALFGLVGVLLLRLHATFKFDGFRTATERDAYLARLEAELL